MPDCTKLTLNSNIFIAANTHQTRAPRGSYDNGSILQDHLVLLDVPRGDQVSTELIRNNSFVTTAAGLMPLLPVLLLVLPVAIKDALATGTDLTRRNLTHGAYVYLITHGSCGKLEMLGDASCVPLRSNTEIL